MPFVVWIRTPAPAAVAVSQTRAGMVVKVKQQHVSHKAQNKPNRRFQDSLELWRHAGRIPSFSFSVRPVGADFKLAPSHRAGLKLDTRRA